jgi:hypothetical protein
LRKKVKKDPEAVAYIPMTSSFSLMSFTEKVLLHREQRPSSNKVRSVKSRRGTSVAAKPPVPELTA